MTNYLKGLTTRAAALSTLLLFAGQSVADKKPTWELGVALGSQYLADYRGSKSYSTTVIPVPFFVYRGKKVTLDRKGLRRDVLSSNLMELNVSGEVSLSAGQNDNELRSGMPELDSSFELGPSLNVALDGNIQDDGWVLRLPLRTVFAAGGNGVEYIGYLANPKVSFVKDLGDESWRFSSNLGFTYGSEKFHDYYYQVDERYALPERPAYDAEAGYSGAYFKTSFTKRYKTWRYGVSLRYDNLSSTDFSQESPLVETDHYYAVSFFAAKFLWESSF